MSEPLPATQYQVNDDPLTADTLRLYSLTDQLDMLEVERRYSIARLRYLEKVLIRHGRLERLTIPERVR
jgi:hypothetical protein